MFILLDSNDGFCKGDHTGKVHFTSSYYWSGYHITIDLTLHIIIDQGIKGTCYQHISDINHYNLPELMFVKVLHLKLCHPQTVTNS